MSPEMRWKIGALLLLMVTAQAAVILLLDETFASGSVPANIATASWSTTNPLGFEVYGQTGFAVRGISGGATPTTGDSRDGIEVLAATTDVTIIITVTLPAGLDDTIDGVFTFLAGQRINPISSEGGFEGDLEIVNVTDSRVLRPQSAVNHPNFTMASNTVNLDFVAADAGDTIELRFYESGGADAQGL